jgi:hypothetical protein
MDVTMDTLTDLLTHCEARRRARVYEAYTQRIGRAPEPWLEADDGGWLTAESIRALRLTLHTAEAAQARGLRHVLRFLCDEYLQGQTQALRDDLLTRQQQAVVDVPALEEPFSLWQAAGLIAGERKRVKRELIETASTAVISGLNRYYRTLWARLFATMESLGYTSPSALWEEVAGVAFDDYLKPLEAILRNTEDTYRDQMQWHLKRAFGIQLETARRHDILALFGLEETTPWFPRADLISSLERWLGDWGWRLADVSNVRLERHAAVAGGAYCAPLRIPADIRLALAPVAGLRGFAHALGETGKALLLASFPADAPLEWRCFPDPSLLQAQVELCAGLVRTPQWLAMYRHVRQPGELLRLIHLERLFIVRRYIGKCLYERTLYEDFTIDGKEEAYRDALRKACGFGYPEAYYLHDVEPAFTTYWTVRGWLLGSHLRQQLQRQYADEWFREHDALETLRRFWVDSPYHTVEALAERLGGSMTDVTPVVADLLSEL